jgi:DNA-binding response OmpR family regulator
MKILIVEDERELMNGITEYLSEEQYQCEFATTFDEAMDKVQAHHYDCVLLDLMLPGGNFRRC